MFCIDEIHKILLQSTSDVWSTHKSLSIVQEQESIQAYRWVHQKTNMGFVIIVGTRSTPVTSLLLRERIQFFRQWMGTNLGLLYLLPGGMEKGAHQALPYYGYLRTAMLDFPEERLHFGSDSSRFQSLVGAIAHLFGIPAGALSRGELELQYCNTLGPATWTQASLFSYQQKNVLGWHPLYLATVFPSLSLALDGLLHDEEHVLLLCPESFPVCSFVLQNVHNRFPKKKLIVLYAHSCTEKTIEFARDNDVKLHHVTTDPVGVCVELGWEFRAIPEMDYGVWSPQLWGTYLRSISYVSSEKVEDCALVVDDHVAYVSSLSILGIEKVVSKLPKHILLVVQSNFAIPQHVFDGFAGYVWMYRDEIIRRCLIPIALEHAFLHFHSFPTTSIYVPTWKERFFQRGERFFDRFRGTEVNVLHNIPSHHPQLKLGFLLSMHRGCIPFMLYDKKEQVLVACAPSSAEKVSKESISPTIQHLYSCLAQLGLNPEDWGVLYTGIEGIQMSLIEEE